MNFYTALPLIFLKFWFLEAPIKMLKFFINLNKAIFNVLSVTLMIKTFFKPWKNEYRKGLVGFQRGMGMFIKSTLLIADFFIISVVLIFEFLVFVGVILLPFLSFWLII